MDPSPLLRGFALGIAVAAPVGPMSLLCMRRTLTGGFSAGFLSGLGVATADGIYAAVAAFGLVAVSDLLVGQQPWLRLLGGMALIYLGVRTLRGRPAERAAAAGASDAAGMYVSTLGLTLMNPATILSFAALFAGAGTTERSGGAAPAMVLGVFLGSAAWWLALTSALARFRRRLPGQLLRAVNWIAGLMLVLFGVVALVGRADANPL